MQKLFHYMLKDFFQKNFKKFGLKYIRPSVYDFNCFQAYIQFRGIKYTRMVCQHRRHPWPEFFRSSQTEAACPLTATPAPPRSPSPWQAPFCRVRLRVPVFAVPRAVGIVRVTCLSVSGTSPRLVSSGFIPAVARVRISFLFEAE